ncbi:chromosome segregation and condensation protein ScpB [Acetobacter tropicalis NBRC 101654]|uniref:Chromosome segregation and condensation protein ScpB n=1 Tax=Acetobacter tropicalis NBRC 101654 TaxID=749388 RepID=F7VIA2_9PROT|nr:chromosome segregation and condensation protein ScpB [Acetobacter tropicalis NBRC 101654]
MLEPSFTVPDDAVRLAEALIFAGTEPVSTRRVAELLEARQLIPDGVDNLAAFVNAVLAALVARYEGRGVAPVEVAGGWQFRTAPDLAPALTRVLERPRRLPRAVMETLAIIAYHQPCTRVEIEEIRGVSLGQNVLDTLIEASLIAPRGRKEVPGRPVLWGTTPDFLRHFGLRALSDLPRREELLVDVPNLEADPRLPSADAPASAPDDEEDAQAAAQQDGTPSDNQQEDAPEAEGQTSDTGGPDLATTTVSPESPEPSGATGAASGAATEAAMGEPDSAGTDHQEARHEDDVSTSHSDTSAPQAGERVETDPDLSAADENTVEDDAFSTFEEPDSPREAPDGGTSGPADAGLEGSVQDTPAEGTVFPPERS